MLNRNPGCKRCTTDLLASFHPELDSADFRAPNSCAASVTSMLRSRPKNTEGHSVRREDRQDKTYFLRKQGSLLGLFPLNPQVLCRIKTWKAAAFI